MGRKGACARRFYADFYPIGLRMNSFERVNLKGIGFGLIGGFIGTALMDTVIVMTLLAAGEPADAFFTAVGEKLGQGAALGIALHNMIGISVGFIFALLVLNVRMLKIDTKRKGLVLGGLAGAITIPVGCIPLAIWLGQPILDVVAFSAAPHMVYGTVLGLVAALGILPRPLTSSQRTTG